MQTSNVLPKVRNSAKETIYPLNVKTSVIGLELSDTDRPLLEYFHFFNQFMKSDEIYCVHTEQLLNPLFPLQAFYPPSAVGLDRPTHQKILEKMQAEVKSTLPADEAEKVKCLVESGPPLEMLAQLVSETQAGLVMIGKRSSSDFHVIKGMNAVRMVEANVMVVPENAVREIQTILVPVDFSEHSVKALKTALAFKHAALHPVRLVALHMFHPMPVTAFGFGGNVAPMSNEDLEEKYDESFQRFLNEEVPDFKDDVEMHLTTYAYTHAAPALLKKASEIDADLIVIGAKGHSRLAAFFLGSTTEALLRKNDDFPVLVIK
ncbi:MAG: universal stress protein [Saprospiraceae bacterium]|nr:universal stress protein [Saprospiraceae bacterium]